MQNKVAAMEALVERLQGSQKRESGDSNSLHVMRVRTLLMNALAAAKENADDAQVIELAALGHDLLEDTGVTGDELEGSFGKKCLQLIKELTNKGGDNHTEAYVRQMSTASEEARLIKYADLCDNLFHASYGARLLGVPWMHNYFLPIVDPMREALDLTGFQKFPKTAGILRTTARLARAHLNQSASVL